MHQNKKHIPVLLEEVLTYLDPQPGESLLDVTAGYGGHARAIVERTKNLASTVLVDRDQSAIGLLQSTFDRSVDIRFGDYYSVSTSLLGNHRSFDLIVADLGVSSPHLNEASRGFAFNQEGPLDMRMDQTQSLTAAIIVNTYAEAAIAKILREYGEEPKAYIIARMIVRNRPITTTTALASLVASVWHGRRSRVHPATRTFQGLRIAVNRELELLKDSLPLWIKLLNPGGRIGIISFHSLEDRLVKQAFMQVSGNRFDAELILLTKKPVTAGANEIVFNPRARSAKLRAAAKIKNRKGSANAHPGKKQLPDL